LICHPTIRLLDVYLQQRGNVNVPTLPVTNNKKSPFDNVGAGFQEIATTHLNSDITIGDYRLISTTAIKKKASAAEYQNFCRLCLHSEAVSNKYYVKENDVI